MADTPKKTETKTDAKSEAKTGYAKASESSDAAVQKLLAEAEIHRMNGDDEKVAEIQKELNQLGYE